MFTSALARLRLASSFRNGRRVAVTFRKGTTFLRAAPLNSDGEAVFTTSSLRVGTQFITASYGNDANFSGSMSAAIIQQVVPTPGGPANDNFADRWRSGLRP